MFHDASRDTYSRTNTHAPCFTRKAPADFKHAWGRMQGFLPHYKHKETNPFASLWPARPLHWQTCLGLTPVCVAWVDEREMCFAKPLKFRPALTRAMAMAAFLVCHHQKLAPPGKEDGLTPGHRGVRFLTEMLWLSPARIKSKPTGFPEGEQSCGKHTYS